MNFEKTVESAILRNFGDRTVIEEVNLANTNLIKNFSMY